MICDHKKRHLRCDTPEAKNNTFDSHHDVPGSSQGGVLGDITNSQDAARSLPPSPNPLHSPARSATPIRPPEENWPENDLPGFLPLAGGRSNPSTAPSMPPRRQRALQERGNEEDDEELPEDDDDRLHHCDQLLNGDEEHGGHGFNDGIVFLRFNPDDANGCDLDDPPKEEDGSGINNENFGLPAGAAPPPGEPLRQFQIPD